MMLSLVFIAFGAMFFNMFVIHVVDLFVKDDSETYDCLCMAVLIFTAIATLFATVVGIVLEIQYPTNYSLIAIAFYTIILVTGIKYYLSELEYFYSVDSIKELRIALKEDLKNCGE